MANKIKNIANNTLLYLGFGGIGLGLLGGMSYNDKITPPQSLREIEYLTQEIKLNEQEIKRTYYTKAQDLEIKIDTTKINSLERITDSLSERIQLIKKSEQYSSENKLYKEKKKEVNKSGLLYLIPFISGLGLLYAYKKFNE